MNPAVYSIKPIRYVQQTPTCSCHCTQADSGFLLYTGRFRIFDGGWGDGYIAPSQEHGHSEWALHNSSVRELHDRLENIVTLWAG